MKTYYVRNTKDMGRGIFADRDFKAGEIICYCELLVLDKDDSSMINDTSLENYTFRFNEMSDCLVLGDGSIFNHNDDENTTYELIKITDALGSRHLMKFTTKKPILQDEQMFINYSADEAVSITPYMAASSLVG